MDLTPENKKHIDLLSYAQLLSHWRNAPVGDEWFQGETGTYWHERMANLKNADPEAAVRASKNIGWGYW
jgi:hypothetical protein